MSIRLRLTLLYSGILALTLFALSTFLYVAQAQATYDAIKTNLARQAQGFLMGPGRPFAHGGESPRGGTLPGRWTQTCELDGSVSARTPDLTDAQLPISAEGLRAVQSGMVWTETAQVEDQPVLVYSQPVLDEGRVVRFVQVAAPIAEREQSLNNLRLILTIGSLVVLLAAFGIGWVLSGAALSPIHRITRTAQVIGAEQDFSRRVEHVGPNDEVGQLATTFNGMLTALQTAFQQLQQALESQRRFVADASHELRTPLTTVRGNIELLGHETRMDSAERAEVLADTQEEVERLIRLVNQLLVLARSDAGRRLHCEPVAIQPLIEDVCRQTKLRAPQRTITCEVSPDAVASADRDALQQVLVILLDNAVAHTPPRATIHVTTDLTDRRVAIRVRDTGPGIAPEALPHIFERFYRGEVSRTGMGTGLGLAIAKELVEAQDGTISVESQIGRGTVFAVTLPRASARS